MSSSIKYEPLKNYLMNCDRDALWLSYEEIEEVIEGSLPDSAYKHRQWWANGEHSQAEAWLAAGWKVIEVELGKYILFERNTTDTAFLNQPTINVGKKYRHFKGNEYLVLHTAKHSETLEDLVVYQALYGERGIWVRPLEMFLEKIERNGEIVRRFEECSQ